MKYKNLKAGEKGTVECVLMCAEEKRTKNMEQMLHSRKSYVIMPTESF